jgi:hypothetical protein
VNSGEHGKIREMSFTPVIGLANKGTIVVIDMLI